MNNDIKKVSFDFDGTLSEHFGGQLNPNKKDIQELFVNLCNSEKYDVYIITRRYGPKYYNKGTRNEHNKVFSLLNELKIELPEENVLFTNREYKFSFIKKLGINLHFDDDMDEHFYIKQNTNASSIDVTLDDWNKDIDELLN